MKKTISAVYPPPPPPPQAVQKQQQHMQKRNPNKLNRCQRGSLAGRQPPPPPPPLTPPPAFLSSGFAMQYIKHLNGISLVGRWFLDIVCWLG